MSKREIQLTSEERVALEWTLLRDPRPYMREKASAVLQVAEGAPVYIVARAGLLRPRKPETVYRWLNEYEAHRSVQAHKPRRRRFSP